MALDMQAPDIIKETLFTKESMRDQIATITPKAELKF